MKNRVLGRTLRQIKAQAASDITDELHLNLTINLENKPSVTVAGRKVRLCTANVKGTLGNTQRHCDTEFKVLRNIDTNAVYACCHLAEYSAGHLMAMVFSGRQNSLS